MFHNKLIGRHVAIALALLLAAAPAAAQESAPAAAPASQSIAVVPVVVHAMAQHDYLRDGVADMLSARLGQYEGLRVIRIGEGAALQSGATGDAPAARALGKTAGADWVLFGSFTRFGTGASLDLRCIRVDESAGSAADERRSIFIQDGSLEEIIPRLSNVAERIAAHVGAGASVAPAAGVNNAAVEAALQTLEQRVQTLEDALQRARAAAAESVANAPEDDFEEDPISGPPGATAEADADAITINANESETETETEVEPETEPTAAREES